MNYNFKKIEKKWQKEWDKSSIHEVEFPSEKPKWYSLVEFPFPSGDGLHTGHVRSYTAMDIVSRKKRMEGYNVLYPIGWDAFGLPTENYAIKTGIHPAKVTKTNTDNYRKQLKSLGLSFDWSREVNTTDPDYYKWTQWIFIKFFEHGLAYKINMPINWCPSCKIGLANEEVIGGMCERCGAETVKKDKEQWMLKITEYAEKLLEGLKDVDYREDIKTQQANWIGRSEGAEVEFRIKNLEYGVRVFTTRPDTLFGATYLVLAPENELVKELKSEIKNWDEVEKYIAEVKNKSEADRTSETVEKTGVELEGIKAINPANDEEIPIFIADYVLNNYGTGAVMAVPAHDIRDWDFAKKYDLPIRCVIDPVTGKKQDNPEHRDKIVALVEDERGQILTLNWGPELGGRLLIGGTVEEGEDLLVAAKREIAEETGYENLELITRSDERVHHEYFAFSKDKSFVAHTQLFHFKLKEGKVKNTKLEDDEKGKFKVEWVLPEKAEVEILDPLHKYTFERFIKGGSYDGEGILRDSGKFDGMDSKEAREKILKFVNGERVIKYKLRDWIFSRQRYWGEPIPIINCAKCGYVAVPEEDLPVTLPEVKDFRPGENGESPLASLEDWVKVQCSKCDGDAKRETDVMPNWAGSSWYFLRYTDTRNDKQFADMKNLKYFMPVDWYNGGMEHVTLHLLYSRFWNHFLYDIGLVTTKEPYKKRTAHGMILGEGGIKMSKSKGNVINPDDIIEVYGADSLRIYEMFMGPFEQAIAWDTKSIEGASRFLLKVWNIAQNKDISEKVENKSLETLIHKTLKKVTEDIEDMAFNTAISSLMIFINACKSEDAIPLSIWKKFLLILAPFAPHISEELWSMLGEKDSIHIQEWPNYDESKIKEEEFELVIQVNGKVRGRVSAKFGISEEDAKSLAIEAIKDIDESNIKRVIFVPNKIINLVLINMSK